MALMATQRHHRNGSSLSAQPYQRDGESNMAAMKHRNNAARLAA